MKKLVLLILVALLPMMASADSLHGVSTEVNIDGIWYNFYGDEAYVDFYGWAIDYIENDGVYYYIGDIVIPESVTYEGKNYTVTAIGPLVFYGCSKLTSVSIPNTVTSIGEGAFQYCTSLKSVNIPSGVTVLKEHVFNGCSSLPGFTIPSGVTTIESGAFAGCSSMPSVKISETVNSIAANAFSGCSNLSSIIVSEQNAVYDSRNNCNAIIEKATGSLIIGCTSSTIPESVTSIGPYAFYGSGLTSISIPDNIAAIGNDAFYNCGSLTSITLPSSITSIEENTFYGSGLTSISIPDNITTIGNGAFQKCGSLTSITLPNSITYLGENAFAGCSALISINIPTSLTSLSKGIFKNCTSLPGFTIPNGITSIGGTAFSGCSSMPKVTIPESVTEIGRDAFDKCDNLTQVVTYIQNPFDTDGFYNFNSTLYVPAGTKDKYLAREGWREFRTITEGTGGELGQKFSQDGMNFQIVEKNEVELISASANVSNIPDKVVKEGTTYYIVSIGGGAYKGNLNLTTVIIPEKVNSIGSSAFEGCTNITSVKLPPSLSVISSCLFYACVNLKTAYLSDDLNTVQYSAFRNCKSLESITFGDNIKSLFFGEDAFGDCDNVSSVTIYTITPPDIKINGEIFEEKSAILYVPYGCREAYKASKYWGSFKEIIEIPDGNGTSVDGVNYQVVSQSEGTAKVISADNGITKAEIPETVTIADKAYRVVEIAANAFSNCKSLSSVKISASVTAIGDMAFYGCTSLTSFNIPSGLTVLNSHVFAGCTSLPGITIPDGITTIREGAFEGCTSMPRVTIAKTVTAIETSAFANCTALTTVRTDIREPFAISGVFNNPNATLYVPIGTKEKYQACEGWKDFKTIEEYSPYGEGTFAYNDVFYRAKDGSHAEAIAADEYATSITIPEFVSSGETIYQVTGIAAEAFKGYKNLVQVKIADSVTEIGSGAFESCSSLNSINIPEGVTVLRSFVFARCSAIGSFAIRKGVTTIEEGAFYHCSGIPRLTIPETVTEIGSKAFYKCSALTDLYCYAEDVPTTALDAFEGVATETATLHVPYELLPYYSMEEPWSLFYNISHLPVVTYIVDGEVYAVMTVRVGEKITPIDEPLREGYLFSGWSEIPEVMPNEDVTVTGTFTIGQYTITYMIDGEFYAKVIVEYGSPIILPQVDQKEGYDFAWEDVPETMPAHDITINGSYTTGILQIETESEGARIYDLNGNRIREPQRGVNIIRRNDGKSVKKIFK